MRTEIVEQIAFLRTKYYTFAQKCGKMGSTIIWNNIPISPLEPNKVKCGTDDWENILVQPTEKWVKS